jgi:Protein of unknown function (DUF3795)
VLETMLDATKGGFCLEAKLISRCGIYCGACYIYRAFKDGGKLLDVIAQQQGVSKEEIRCNGCLGPVEDLWRNCRVCPVRVCLKNKGLEFCYECPDFEDSSCVGYERLCEGCKKRGEETREALLRIKAGDADNWRREQDAKWRCSGCGSRVWWEQETCFQCGQPIGKR